jgi:hypothetical protein
MYSLVYLLNIRNTLEDNVRRSSGNNETIPDTAPTTQTQTNMSRYTGAGFDLPTDGTPTQRYFSEYEKDVIGFYERFGYVERRDRDIIENYFDSRREEGESFDDRELERTMTYEETYGPDAQLPPEYPFQDFNYGP